MSEDEARALVQRFTDAAGMERLERLIALVLTENDRQNLIARSTTAAMWNRHVLDSVQLLQWAGDAGGLWLDVGTGGGFPGLAIAAITARPMWLVEPRRRRAEFLDHTVSALGLRHATVQQTRVEVLHAGPAAVISARAVAPIGKLLHSAAHCATTSTLWLLPRGSDTSGIDAVEREWKGLFHVKQSLSDANAKIVVATAVSRR